MRNIYIIFILLLSCQNWAPRANQSQNSIVVTDSILNKTLFKLNEISFEEYEKLKKNISIVQIQPLNIKKMNNKIHLSLNDGSYKEFADSIFGTDDTRNKEYVLKGLYKEVNLYLIQANYYEGGEYILVNKKNGEVYNMWSLPIISPDHQKIISFGNSLGYEIMPNGIQYFEIINGTPKIKWEYNTQKWKPEDLRWITNNVLILKQVIPDFISTTQKEQIKYFKLIIN
jgi:hypothetical protein